LDVSIGTKLKALRLQAGLTQVQLAQAAGILQSALACYEQDKDVPSAPRLVAIARALGTTAEEIVDDALSPTSTVDPKPRIHGNSLAAKIQDIFLKLKAEEQKAIYRQAEALLQRREQSAERPAPTTRPKKATTTQRRPAKAA
jgi:transcriptional regulator with XRE-family HTH domain